MATNLCTVQQCWYILTNPTEQNSSWEVDSRSHGQDIQCHLLNPKIHLRVHKSLPLDPILSQMNVIYSAIPYF